MEQKRKKDTNFEYHNNFNRKNYDRVNIMVPKGRREVWKSFAAGHGMSVNALVNQAVESKIESENQNQIFTESESKNPNPD